MLRPLAEIDSGQVGVWSDKGFALNELGQYDEAINATTRH